MKETAIFINTSRGKTVDEAALIEALPHIGSATRQTRFDMAMTAAKNLVAAVSGEVPPDLIPELQEITARK